MMDPNYRTHCQSYKNLACASFKISWFGNTSCSNFILTLVMCCPWLRLCVCMCTCMHMCAFSLSVVFQIHGLAIRSLDSLAMFADFMRYKHLDDDEDKNQLY